MAPIFGDLISKLTGGGSSEKPAAAGKSEEYRGFTITPAPRREGSQWLTAGIISKGGEGGGEAQEHSFIRADRHSSREEAETFSIAKAKLIIDEQGDGLFGRGG